ncbi:unnamed protein product [Periconia digitata]|uniref:Uncharacterized protein n=1 Tax=Periconia digitata TaxID=1303443 RepID=A0A9W4UM18_9PLEO|nr:unnamed protein product [Periconia digitata]
MRCTTYIFQVFRLFIQYIRSGSPSSYPQGLKSCFAHHVDASSRYAFSLGSLTLHENHCTSGVHFLTSGTHYQTRMVGVEDKVLRCNANVGKPNRYPSGYAGYYPNPESLFFSHRMMNR